MKRVVRFAIAALACALLVPGVRAQSGGAYPERPITVVVPWPAGGFTDRLGRMIAEKLAASLNTPVVVDNRPGASAGIGSEYVMRAAPDGYTLLVTSTDGTVKLLQGKDTDPVSRFTQLTMLAIQPVTFSVGPKFTGNSLAKFIEAAKASPGTMIYASNGERGATHLGMEIFARQAGIQLIHVPYKGTAPALADLVGGQVDAALVSLQGLGAFLQNGRARALAITSDKRVAAAPSVPTFAESGYPSFDLNLWYGMVAPKGLPAPIVEKLSKALNAAISAPDVQDHLRAAAAEPLGGSPQDMLQFVQKEAERWKSVIR